MSPEQRDIAMQTMKKAKNTDTENIPKEEEESHVKTQDPVDRPEEEQSNIT